MHCAYCGSWVEQVSYAPCASCGLPTNGARARAVRGGGGANPAMIIVGVVAGGRVIVAFIGILAAIAIPNLLNAMQRARQKRTMADMRTVAVAAESFAVDNNVYPRAESMDELKPLLMPKYTTKLPVYDGWGNELRYRCKDEGCTGYAITSSGGDKMFEHVTAGEYPGGATTSFDSDIIFSDGKFVQYPEGVQH
jgi:type II secretory pathway pseudopilin PulG